MIVIASNGVTIDYSVAGEYAREVRAFAIIESKEQPTIIGDSGQAFGLLQIHPTTFKRWYGLIGFPLDNSDTWVIAEIKTCASFLRSYDFNHQSQQRRDLIVQAWNCGERGVFIEGERNPEYLAHWLAAYDSIQGILTDA